MANPEYIKEWRRRRAEAGLCLDCPNRREPDRTRCSDCAARNRQRAINPERREYIKAATTQYRRDIRQGVLDAYGHACACCGESAREFLTVDHPDNDGAEHRRSLFSGRETSKVQRIAGFGFYLWLRRNNYPPEFRLLCWNCNASRGHYGQCPHETARTKT